MESGGDLSAPLISGAAEMVSFVEGCGVDHVFGLSGSSIVSLFHELHDSKVTFVPAIHESVSMAMADGYARVRGSSFVFLYMLPGSANALGNLYNAWRDESPVVVVAAQQSTYSQSPQGTVGEAALSALVEPFTCLSWEVQSRASLGWWLRRMLRTATSPPTGPTLLAVPKDILEGRGLPERLEPSGPRVRSVPVDTTVVARALAEARRPLIVAGGQVRRAGGARALSAVAEGYQCPVVYEPYCNDTLAIDPGHPNCMGPLVANSQLARDADVVVIVGARYFNEVHPTHQPWFPGAHFVAHVNADPRKLEEHHLATWCSEADPCAFLESLSVSAHSDSSGAWIKEISDIRAKRSPRSDPNEKVGRALARVLESSWLVDESVSASSAMVFSLEGGDGGRYIGTSGGSLGWGVGAACGVALASNERVTCVVGDGAFLFGIHGLWTAAAMKLPITFVVLDNGGYAGLPG